MSPAEAEDMVLYQIAAVAGVAAAEGVRLQHVKPHGALFNMAARNARLASAIAAATASFDRSLILFGPPASELLNAGRGAGLRVAAEVFADRAYRSRWLARAEECVRLGTHDSSVVVSRAVRMVRDRVVEAVDGTIVPSRPTRFAFTATHGGRRSGNRASSRPGDGRSNRQSRRRRVTAGQPHAGEETNGLENPLLERCSQRC